MRKLLRGVVVASTLLSGTVHLGGTATATHGPCEITDPQYRFTGATARYNPDPTWTYAADIWGTDFHGTTQLTVSVPTPSYLIRITVWDGDCTQLVTCGDHILVSVCSATHAGPVLIQVEFERFDDVPFAYTLTATPAGAPQAPPQCHDHLDNDADGQADYPNDPGCDSATDDSELTASELPTACDDGIDNDLDGATDHPADADCASPDDTDEGPLQPAAACDDGVDNDLDGATDYPADPQCDSAGDPDESAGTGDPLEDLPPLSCDETSDNGVCVDVDTGAVVVSQTVYQVAPLVTATHTVDGWVDAYRFPLPTGGSAVLPCVVLKVNSTTANPCAIAGGTFVERFATLVSQPVNQPGVGQGLPLTTVSVCAAEYTVKVGAFGLEDFPAYALC